jgi:hypothetical protein
MNNMKTTFALLTLVSLAACQSDAPPETPVDSPAASAGKPVAPVSLEYQVVGNAIVGQPTQVNIEVKSGQGPVNVHYSIADGSALMFQTDQVERVEILDPSAGSMQQVAVVPQREGRVYLNVSAEVETPGGVKIRSMAIPIRVGKAPQSATPNGDIQEGPDGETVISMPAEENPRR